VWGAGWGEPSSHRRPLHRLSRRQGGGLLA
jgi:hypothetical protein